MIQPEIKVLWSPNNSLYPLSRGFDPLKLFQDVMSRHYLTECKTGFPNEIVLA